ncbi:uncharacterized protein [Periplaneta americana]|uniref:uncharacterized protein n=1 Tax=Periplaneta americana TaxID=6978 RepID=UPI0037E97BE0
MQTRLRCRYLALLLLGLLPVPSHCITMRPEVTVAAPTVNKARDYKPDGTLSPGVGYLSPGVQTSGPLGQAGLGPYSLALLGHNPLLTSLLLSSLLSNPALGLGYGGIGYKPQYYGGHLYGRDPLVPLLLRQYGKYLPYGLGSYGLYGYSAPNSLEDTKPFGSYKYEYRL